MIIIVTASLDYLNLSTIYHSWIKLSEWFEIVIEITKDVIIDRKDKRHNMSIYL